MTDEKYLFTQDVRQKKDVARCARNKRTHNGKGGSVKFPSDNLTRKEIKAMSGEVRSYRLNEPMSYKEFKKMPDDIKVVYIKALRQKYGVSYNKIAEMLGTSPNTMLSISRILGIPAVGHTRHERPFDKEAWLAWLNGAPSPAAEEVKEEPVVVDQIEHEAVCDLPKKAIPCSGCMTFEGTSEEALNTVGLLLGGANVRICIKWELIGNG